MQKRLYFVSLHAKACEPAHTWPIASELAWLSLNRSLDSRVFTEDDKTLFNIINILNKTNMKKKVYEKPSVEVVELKQTGMLMTSGNLNATMNDTWTEEDI